MHRALPVVILLLATCSNNASPDAGSREAGSGTSDPGDTTQLAQYVVGAFADSKGGLWFGTIENGVAHVKDGKISFIDSTYGLPPNGGHGIAESRDGLIWIAGHDGVYLHDPEHPGPVQVLHTTGATVRNDRSGNVWVSTMGRVYRYRDASAGEEFPVPVPAELPTVYSISQRKLVFQMEDSRGNLWFSTDGHGAFRYDGTEWAHFTKADGLCSNTPWAIEEDAQGRIWFACIQAFQPHQTGDGGLCRYDGTSFTTFPDVDGLHHNDLYTLYKDREGNLYSSAVGTGMYRIRGDEFTLFNATDRPDLNGGFGLQAMVQDRKGTLWCGYSGGLFRFDGRGFVNVPRGGPWE
ncbi:MAG: hypothetical protein KDB97_03000 [Flavobacteriales bacterium]|nr:hypothetical protein [Flavobacteriales bacterium]